MDLRVVESFVQAAHCGSFSGAARTLGISPAAVSRNVKCLEQRLQMPLFERTTRHVRLTSEGVRRLAHCEAALKALDAGLSRPRQPPYPPATLRITASPAFSRTYLLPLLPGFLASHPGSSLQVLLPDLKSGMPAEGSEVVISRRILSDSAFVSRQLLAVVPLICASPAYLAAHGAPRTIDDLGGHRLIGIRSSPGDRVAAWRLQSASGPAVRLGIEPALVVGDAETAACAALHGLGLAQVGSDLVMPYLAASRLKTALAGCEGEVRGLYVSWAAGPHTTGLAALFAEHLVDHFAWWTDLNLLAGR